MYFFVLVSLFLFLLYIFRGRRTIKPPFAPNFPRFIWVLCTSSLADLFKEIVKLGETTSQLGGITRLLDFKFLTVYAVTSPEDAATMLYQCAEKSFFYDLIKPYVGDQLVAASVSVFKRNRTIMDLTMKTEVLEQYLETFNKYSRVMVEEMGTKVDVQYDFSHILTKNILNIASQVTMGRTDNGEDLITDNYVKAVDRELEVLVNRVKRPWLFFDVFFNMSKERRAQDKALEVIWALSEKMIKLRKEEHYKRLKNENVKKGEFDSFLEVVIRNTVTADHELYTDIELRHLVENMMLASFDTTSSAIIYTLLCLGSNPKVQENIYEETDRVISPKGRPVTKDDLSRLVYLEAVIKESLRLYPIGPIIARRASRNMKLGQYIIPEGSQLLVHVWSINRNKDLWGADADEFVPERWLDPDRIPSNPVAFGSFSPGRRYCIGKTYAMNLMKIVLAHLLVSYKVTSDISKLELEFVVLLKPVSGHTFRIQKREE